MPLEYYCRYKTEIPKQRIKMLYYTMQCVRVVAKCEAAACRLPTMSTGFISACHVEIR